MARRTLAEAAAAMGGRLLAGDPAAVCDGAAIDSRKVRAGELFFAFRGERTDGHRFVEDALARGAAAAVVEREVPAPAAAVPGGGGGGLVLVEDSLRALQALARSVRETVPRRLVGITGSAGKTTTKELLAAMLATRFATAATPGNLNSQIGFPMALVDVPDGTEWMVAEMGMSSAGELAQLSRLGRPDAAVFTVVRPVHLEFFDSLRGIAEAKAELLAGLAPGGLVVANADDPEVARIARERAPAGSRVVWYGVESPAEVRAVGVAPAAGSETGSRFTLEAGAERQAVRLPLHGLYNVVNCLAAAACAWALGVPLGDVARAVADVKPAAMRGVVHRLVHPLPGGATIVDDSYNSNPDAVAKALESAALLEGRRRWAVLGEMRELGPEGPRFHREAGERAARLGFAPVVGVGELARGLAAAAEAAGAPSRWFPDAAAAAEWAAMELRAGDVLLVKGSRGVGLEAVVRRLLAEENR